MSEEVKGRLPGLRSDAVCVCGCRADKHWTVWKDGEFRGTRCKDHGGHKFAFLSGDTSVTQEPAAGAESR